jgi:MFS family permease
MMNRLRGRNLAHPGCLIGVTLGLIIGIILAGVLAVNFNVAFDVVGLLWLAITVVLGAIGWIVGTILTPRFPAATVEEDTAPANETVATGSSEQQEKTATPHPAGEEPVRNE